MAVGVDDAEPVIEKVYGVKVDLLDAALETVVPKAKTDLRIYLRGEYLKRLVMCTAMYMAYVVPSYALMTFLPIMLEALSISGKGAIGLIIETVIISLIAIGSACAIFLVERAGRRPLALSHSRPPTPPPPHLD